MHGFLNLFKKIYVIVDTVRCTKKIFKKILDIFLGKKRKILTCAIFSTNCNNGKNKRKISKLFIKLNYKKCVKKHFIPCGIWKNSCGLYLGIETHLPQDIWDFPLHCGYLHLCLSWFATSKWFTLSVLISWAGICENGYFLFFKSSWSCKQVLGLPLFLCRPLAHVKTSARQSLNSESGRYKSSFFKFLLHNIQLFTQIISRKWKNALMYHFLYHKIFWYPSEKNIAIIIIMSISQSVPNMAQVNKIVFYPLYDKILFSYYFSNNTKHLPLQQYLFCNNICKNNKNSITGNNH